MEHLQEAYPRVEHLKGASLELAPALTANIRLAWKDLLGTNTSLLRKSANYGCNTFIGLARDLYYETFYSRNLRQMARFRSKLVPFLFCHNFVIA